MNRDDLAGRHGFHADILLAYLAGLEDASKYPGATARDRERAADGYVKLWQIKNKGIEVKDGA